MYMSETIPTFEKRLTALNRSGKTIIGYRSDVTNLIHFLDDKYNLPTDPAEITVEDIWDFMSALREDGKSGKSINRILHGIRSYFDCLTASGVVSSNPARSVPRVSEYKTERQFLTEVQLQTLLSASSDPIIQTPLFLLAYTGMRVSEGCMALLGDVNLSQGVIKVHGKGAKDRTIRIHPVLQSMLEIYVHDQWGTSDPYCRLFRTHTTDSISPSTVNRWLALLTEDLEWSFSVTAHTLRHTFAYMYIRHGGDVVELQKILGHESLAITTVYTHKTPDELARGIDRLPEFYYGR